MSHILFIYCYILLSQYHTGQFLLVSIGDKACPGVSIRLASSLIFVCNFD